MAKKIFLAIGILAVIVVVFVAGRYLYHNVFNNQYEFTYEIKERRNWDPFPRTYKFTAPNDSVAAERAILKLTLDLDGDNYTMADSSYCYHYNNLRLDNVTKKTLVRVPAKLIRMFLLDNGAKDLYKLDEREIDWLMFADSIPYYNYSMTIYLDNPYEEKDLNFISHSDYTAADKAIDTLAYCISHYWYPSRRPIDDVNVVNNTTLDFVHSLTYGYVRYHLSHSPYCKGLNINSYPIEYRGLMER